MSHPLFCKKNDPHGAKMKDAEAKASPTKERLSSI
jgi:hypothetical protein